MANEKIIDYTDFISRSTDGFVGRHWLQAQFDAFLTGAGPTVFLLSGEPGVGKTAFLAHLGAQRGYIHHFVSAQELDWVSPVAFVESLAEQLAARYGPWLLAEEEALPGIAVEQDVAHVAAGGRVIGVLIQQYVGLPVEELARKLVWRPLQRLAARQEQPVVLTVDGLDEATTYSGKPNINDLLVHLASAPNLRLLVSANPGLALAQLNAQFPRAGLHHVVLDEQGAPNLEDVRLYLEHALQEPAVQQAVALSGLSGPAFTEQMVAHSDGNFLYLTTLIKALRQDATRVDLQALPASLADYYRAHFLRQRQEVDRQQWREVYRPVMGVLTVARAPLAVRALADLAAVEREAVDEVLESLSLFLDRRERDGRPLYRWYHRALADFLASEADNPDNWFDPQKYHTQIAGRLHARFPDPATIDDEYALNHLAAHDRLAGPDAYPRLFAMITPAVRRAWRLRLQSDYLFSQTLAEAIQAALALEPPAGLAELVRCGLVDATLGAITATVPPDLLRALAGNGQWARALNLAQLNSSAKGADLQAIVEGLLARGHAEDLALVRQVAAQIPAAGEDAANRALALAQIAVRLSGETADQATALFNEAATCAEAIPGLDSRGRTLAQLAGWRASSDEAQAKALFDQALAAVRAMSAELDAASRELVATANIVAQTVTEAAFVARRTPFDTLGAKARALADIAAELARAHDGRAASVFTEAEEIAAQIGAGDIQAVFREHTVEYIAARRSPPPAAEPSIPSLPADLEAQLQALERVPPDEQGFYARALLSLANALLAGGEPAQARPVLERSEAASAQASGGFKAELWLAIADGWRAVGDEARAKALAEAALRLAGDEADFPTRYVTWLAERGRQAVTELREIAAVRGMIQKRRFYSAGALAQMAQSLAATDPAGAEVLAGNIQDPYQAARAYAAIAGRLAQTQGERAEALLQMVEDRAMALPVDQRDVVLAGAVEILTPLDKHSAQRLSTLITDVGRRALALSSLAANQPAQDQAAEPLWAEVWQMAQQAAAPGAALALALAHLGQHWADISEARAAQAFDQALGAARGEPSPAERVDALTQVALALSRSATEQARQILTAAEEAARRLDGPRAQGRALSRLAAVWLDLDAAQAGRLLADLRRLGRENFLDGVAQIAPGVARLGGTALIGQLFEALEAAEAFFTTGSATK
jgi:hypothetical protein